MLYFKWERLKAVVAGVKVCFCDCFKVVSGFVLEICVISSPWGTLFQRKHFTWVLKHTSTWFQDLSVPMFSVCLWLRAVSVSHVEGRKVIDLPLSTLLCFWESGLHFLSRYTFCFRYFFVSAVLSLVPEVWSSPLVLIFLRYCQVTVPFFFLFVQNV